MHDWQVLCFTMGPLHWHEPGACINGVGLYPKFSGKLGPIRDLTVCNIRPRDFTNSCPHHQTEGEGVGLSERAWTRLNRLQTGVGRFGANMLRWGLSTSDSGDCGAEQTTCHITSGRCPICRPPGAMIGLIELDVKTQEVLWTCE